MSFQINGAATLPKGGNIGEIRFDYIDQTLTSIAAIASSSRPEGRNNGEKTSSDKHCLTSVAAVASSSRLEDRDNGKTIWFWISSG